jgi:hypothetical protein
VESVIEQDLGNDTLAQYSAPLPKILNEMATVVVGDKGYVIGGTDMLFGSRVSSAVYFAPLSPPNLNGTIQVTTNLSSAPFSITGPASFNGTGTSTVTNAPAGTYTITFDNVAGYTTPPQQTMTLSAGGTIIFSGTYSVIVQTGNIQVTTNFPGAIFTISGPATYSATGTSFLKSGAPTGTYTITYRTFIGVTAPLSETRTLSPGGTISFSGTYQNAGPRKFLVTFTGWSNMPPVCNYRTGFPAGECWQYPKGYQHDGNGMTTLLNNLEFLNAGVISGAFAFYSGANGNPLLAPSDESPHVEALNWLNSFGFNFQDRIVIAGHSYGGNRARLFARQVHDAYGNVIDALVLADPIDWLSCQTLDAVVPVVGPCNQEGNPVGTARFDIPATVVQPNRTFLFLQSFDPFIRGY